MQISSLNNKWSLYNLDNTQSTASTSTAQSDSQTDTASSTKKHRYDSLDSYSAQQLFSGMMSQGIIPASTTSSDSTDASTSSVTSSTSSTPPPPPPANTGSSSDVDSSIISFLDKVKSGTVTDADLTSLQSVLTSANTGTDSSDSTDSAVSSSASSTSSTLSMKDFIDKLKDGTVTDSDLSTMQSELNSVQGESETQKMPPPPPPSAADASSSTSSIMSFLDKVKNGTVTDSDLSAMQSELSSSSSNNDSTTNDASGQLTSNMSQQLLQLAMQAYESNSSNTDWNAASSSTNSIYSI